MTCSMAAAWSAVSSKRKAGLKRAVFSLAGQHPRALPGGAARIQIEQFGRDVANPLCGFAACLLPLVAAELVQRRRFRRRAGIARHQVQRLNRYIQLVAIGIFEHQKFTGVAGDIHGLQSDVAADAVGLVHHRRADAQIRQLFQYLRRITLRPASPAFLAGAIAE